MSTAITNQFLKVISNGLQILKEEEGEHTITNSSKLMLTSLNVDREYNNYRVHESLRCGCVSCVFVTTQFSTGIKGEVRSMKTWRILSDLKKSANTTS